MTTFDDREQAFEKKFAHDAEMQFKAEARRNKKLGLWAADKLGMSGADAASFAGQVVAADMEEPGDEDVYRFVKAAFDKAGVAVAESDLRERMSTLMVEAKAEIFEEN